jgi:hypothetical protein
LNTIWLAGASLELHHRPVQQLVHQRTRHGFERGTVGLTQILEPAERSSNFLVRDVAELFS